MYFQDVLFAASTATFTYLVTMLFLLFLVENYHSHTNNSQQKHAQCDSYNDLCIYLVEHEKNVKNNINEKAHFTNLKCQKPADVYTENHSQI